MHGREKLPKIQRKRGIGRFEQISEKWFFLRNDRSIYLSNRLGKGLV
jgi:hypothetical protein